MMAFYTTMQHLHENRMLKPRYARTQATPQAVVLDPAFDSKTGDIFPGSVLSRLDGNKVTLCDGTKLPAGLSGSFCAPVYGVDEVRGAGNMDMTMWVLSRDAIFTVAPPAYDTEAAWTGEKTNLDAGKEVYLKSDEKGLLTLEDDAQTKTANTVCRLIGLDGDLLVIAGL